MIKKSNLLCVTGCSHTAGTESYDPFYIENYESFANTYKSKPNHEVKKKLFHLRTKHLLSKKNKSFFNKMVTNPIFYANLVERYFQYMDKKNSWPNNLKNLFPDYDVVNLATSGASFKRSISNFINFLKRNRYEKIIAIHQVPSLGRTYIKIKGIKYDFSAVGFFEEQIYIKGIQDKKILNAIKTQYKKIVQRDINSNYFVRARKKHLALLKKISLKFNVKNYYITEDVEDYKLFANEKVILKDFLMFRDNYKKGSRRHVVDNQFTKDIVDIVYRFLIEDLKE